MAHLQYIPGDPRLVDQLVYELKSKGIFDQFRKDCIADVDTRPAYQNLRQRVESSVATFLARQVWQPDLNKNQLREKLRKHILDGNYLEQGVERIVDQVVNPKVASVFIPQVEDLVYKYLGITRKKTIPVPETSTEKVTDNNLLPTDLEAVSPGSVNDDKIEDLDIPGVDNDEKMDVDKEEKAKQDIKDETNENKVKPDAQDTQMSGISDVISVDSNSSMDKSNIPLPSEEIKLENIPVPENSPPKATKIKVELENKSNIPLPSEEIKLENIPVPENSPPKATKIKVELEKIQLPEEPNVSTDIPLPEETFKSDKEHYFKPVNSDDDDSSSDSSLRRNMSPLTPIRNFNNENSCDAQQAFDNDSLDSKTEKKEIIEPNTFRFTIESKNEDSTDDVKPDKKDTDQANLSYQFNNQVNINAFNTPMYDDSSNSNLLHIDYESDANSKLNLENKPSEVDQNSSESKKNKKDDEKKSSHRSSYHKHSHKHSSSKDRRLDSKQSSSRDSRSDKKSSKDDRKSGKSSNKERSSERSDKKESRDSSKHRISSGKSSSHRDSKSHRSSSSSQRHSSSKHSDDKKSSSSSNRDKERSSKDDKNSKEKSSKESKSTSSSHRSDKDRKNSSSSKSKNDDKDKKKDKKDTDDHYSASGRGSHSRRSTDRDSNDGSTSSKGSHIPSSAKSSDSKKENKSSNSKSDTTSTSGDSTSPSDKDHLINEMKNSRSTGPQNKPVIRVDNHLEVPIHSPPRLPFVPDVTLKKPKIAANLEEARKLMKMRKFLDEEQKRMNQEAALLLEFQANVRPSMSQVYSSIPGPELEFACINTPSEIVVEENNMQSDSKDTPTDTAEARNDSIHDILTAAEQVENIDEVDETGDQEIVISAVETEPLLTVIEIEKEEEVKETDKATVHIENSIDTDDNVVEHMPIEDKNIQVINDSTSLIEDEESQQAIIEIKESDIEEENEIVDTNIKDTETIEDDIEMKLTLLHEKYYTVQVTVEAEELSDTEEMKVVSPKKVKERTGDLPGMFDEEIPFEYFAEHEKYKAEIDRDTFSKFLKAYTEKCTEKLYLINCETYEEKIIRDVLKTLGTYEVVNYYKNGTLKLNTAKNVVKNVNVSSEISLPVESVSDFQSSPHMFSPVKSECSFELSSDYDARLEEMVSKTSRKEIMEIILGNTEESAMDSEMPTIDYCNESNIESDTENTVKRKYSEVESSENNNRQVLTPNKIRKLSDSEQITSTTEESEVTSNNNVTLNTSVRSKYLGRARRVGLPRPRRPNVANSPSSDKSIENYEQNTPVTQTPNGKMKTPRNKVQRYDTSDLYKPKLHYLSRRNNIS